MARATHADLFRMHWRHQVPMTASEKASKERTKVRIKNSGAAPAGGTAKKTR